MCLSLFYMEYVTVLQYYSTHVVDPSVSVLSAAKPMVQDWFKARCVEPLPSNGGVR